MSAALADPARLVGNAVATRPSSLLVADAFAGNNTSPDSGALARLMSVTPAVVV